MPCSALRLKDHQTFLCCSARSTPVSLSSGTSSFPRGFERYVNQNLINDSTGTHFLLSDKTLLHKLTLSRKLSVNSDNQTSAHSLLLKIFSALVLCNTHDFASHKAIGKPSRNMFTEGGDGGFLGGGH